MKTKPLLPIDQVSSRTLYMRMYRAKRCTEMAEYQATYSVGYREKNKASIRAQQAAWRAANRIAIAERKAAAYRANKDQKAIYDLAYREVKKAEIAAYQIAWRTANPDVRAAHSRNRKARNRNAEGTHTAAEIIALLESQARVCIYCPADITEGFHADHIHPLSRGGSNWIKNIQLLCPTCNIRKHDRTHEEFVEYLMVTSSSRDSKSPDAP